VITIALFEVRRRLRLLSTWMLTLLFFAAGMFFTAAAGGAIKGANVDFGTGSKVNVNAPASIYLLILITGTFGFVQIAALAGPAVQQDFEHRTGPFFFTAPISKLDYLGGRFLGAFATLFLMHLGMALGAFLSVHAGWLDPAKIGPERPLAYVIPYLTAVAPNVFFASAIFFSIGALSRRMLSVYVSSVILLVGYLIATNLVVDAQNQAIASFLDPFGLQAADIMMKYWSVVERNERLVPLEGYLLYNRLLWTGIGAALLVLTYVRFRFTEARAPGKTDEAAAPRSAAIVPTKIPDVTPSFTSKGSLMLLFALLRLQARETMKSPTFLVLKVAGVLFLAFSAGSVGELYGTRTYPVTYQVLELGGVFTFFILIATTFYSGELVWRERDAGLGQIHDATPAPRWVLFASKLLTLMAIQLVLVAVIMVTGIAFQTLRGYHHYEIGLYLRALFGIRLLQYWSLAALGITVHSVLNHKIAGHTVMVLVLVTMVALPPLGFEHPLYRYGFTVQYQYSAMNGFGHYTAPLAWLAAYWSAAAVALVFVASAFWPRGMPGSFRERLRRAAPHLKSPGLFAALAVFAALGAFIYYNANVLAQYRPLAVRQERRAAYEKAYKAYDLKPRPKITAVHADVDIEPSQRRVRYAAKLTLENRTEEPLSEVALTILPEAKVNRVAFEGGADATLEDRKLGFSVYRLHRPLAAFARITLDFEIVYEHPGFALVDPDNRIVENGTFIDQDRGITIGYRPSVELDGDSMRQKHGLAPRVWAPPSDRVRRARSFVGPDADWIHYDANVSTSADQIPITSGRLERSWQEGGRNHAHYVVDSPMLNLYSFLSARYAVARDRWNDVDIEINYHPGHEYNLDRMIRSVKASLDYFTPRFGPYQHKIVRIVEFPRYDNFAQADPNTIPYSESIGFIAEVRDAKPDEIDYPYFVTAHEMAHQWWAHQVIGADVQGSSMLAESLAEYSAFMVMKQTFGRLAMRRFLRYELDRYLSGRGRETRPERPLVLVEDTPHIHYAKGSLAMYALADAIGEDRVNAVLGRFCKEWAFKGPPYPVAGDLVAMFRAEAPDKSQLIADLFETITLYELRAVSATATPREGGGVNVRLRGKVKKFRADEIGREQEMPVDDDIPVGVLGADDKLLVEERVHVKGEDFEVVLRAPDGAEKAAIDPSSEMIDRHSDDNEIAIERE
jgi:ABC-2 type transport system permease protein